MLPRLEVQHTSAEQSGQIFMPRVNLLLALVVALLVLGFQESSSLASAYGISVTGNMLITTLLLFFVMKRIWHWSLAAAAIVTAIFLIIDVGFFSANIVKVFEGGWASILVAGVVVVLMTTWVMGSRALFDKTRRSVVPLDFFTDQLAKKPPTLVPERRCS